MIRIKSARDSVQTDFDYLREFCKSFNSEIKDKLITTSDADEITILERLCDCKFIFDNGQEDTEKPLLIPFSRCQVKREIVYQYLLTAEVWTFLVGKEDESAKICKQRVDVIKRMLEK